MASSKGSVAVIGLGACGLATLKNFIEAGFEATAFESNDYVAGLWQHTLDPAKLSVLRSTVANLSKEMGCYTDFPYPSTADAFPTGLQVAKYMNDYADHFDLRSHMRLGTKIENVSRKDDKWEIQHVSKDFPERKCLMFDRVAVTNGLAVQKPKIVTIPGIDTFIGHVLHSNAYKDASAFDGKRVVVVGLGNTGPDTALDLIGHASNIWLSCRHGNTILARFNTEGKPSDHVLSLRLAKLGGLFNANFPNLAAKASMTAMHRIMTQTWSDHLPLPSICEPQFPYRKVPTLNDKLIPAITANQISTKPALASIEGSTLHFSDGSTLPSIDAIIFCTGFLSDYTLMDPSVDPTRQTRKDWSSLPGANGRPLPRLYQGIFSLDHPDSLVFLGTSPLTPQACLNYDISSAAVAQIWLGNSKLPTMEEMNAHVDRQHGVVCEIARTGELANTNYRNNWEWFKWCDEAAGLGLVKRSSFGVEGWKFWWEDRKLCGLVMDGMMSPHLFRLFDEGKRKLWSGAREAVEAANAKR